MRNPVKDCLFGMATGSALGLPVIFESRENLKNNPVTDIESTEKALWSNDLSLAFCLADALTEGFDLQRIIDFFIDWAENKVWSVTDILENQTIDQTTLEAIKSFQSSQNFEPEQVQILNNGSLKRILPLVFYTYDKPAKIRFLITQEVTYLTHPSETALIANFYLLEFARSLLFNDSPLVAYHTLQESLPVFLKNAGISDQAIEQMWRLLFRDIYEYDSSEIRSGVDAIDTLEASIWALLRSGSFVDAVLNAVNLGGNTDALGMITGGLAGLHYGFDNIPKSWIDQLALKDKIEHLAEALYELYAGEQLHYQV